MLYANQPTLEWYTNLLAFLSNDGQEARRYMQGLETRARRTLQRHLKAGIEKRTYRINDDYLNKLHAHFHGGFKSALYSSILQRITLNYQTQQDIDKMLGTYKVYRLAMSGSREARSTVRIAKSTDGTYIFTDHSVQLDRQFDYHGYAFLIRRRLHLLAVLPQGIRMTILNYAEEPDKYSILAILLSVRFQETLEKGEKEDIFAARLIFFREDHPSYNQEYSRADLEKLLSSSKDSNSLIVA
jgi:hypothetical protein